MLQPQKKNRIFSWRSIEKSNLHVNRSIDVQVIFLSGKQNHKEQAPYTAFIWCRCRKNFLQQLFQVFGCFPSQQ
jgi:hypothetical protein